MSHHHSQSGFTLVELLVATVILTVLMTGIYQLFRVHNLMAAKQEETTRMQQDLLSIMTLMTENLRMCGYDPKDIGTLGFNSTNATTLICTRGRTGENTWNATDRDQTIGYRFLSANDTIQWYDAQNDVWTDISEDIANAQFSYFDSNGATTNTPDEVQTVGITITAKPSSARENMSISSRTMTTRVTSRNLSNLD